MSFKIVFKEKLNDRDFVMGFAAPQIAAQIKPGQFIMFLPREKGERIPMSVRKAENGVIYTFIREAGVTTKYITGKEIGETILHIIGPQGTPIEIKNYGTVIVASDSVCAHAWTHSLIAALVEAGNHVIAIQSFDNRDELYPEWALNSSVASEFVLTFTQEPVDNVKHFNDVIKRKISAGERFDAVFAGGELLKLKQLARMTSKIGVPTYIEAHQLMVDGTGMCGACRVLVDGEMKLTCIDGPFFEASKLDFDSMINRYGTYRSEEKTALEHFERGE